MLNTGIELQVVRASLESQGEILVRLEPTNGYEGTIVTIRSTKPEIIKGLGHIGYRFQVLLREVTPVESR